MNKTPSPRNPDDFNDPLERNMKKLFAPLDKDGHADPARLGAEEKDAMFAQIAANRFRKPGRWFLFFCVSLGILMPLGVVFYEWISQALDMQLMNMRQIFYDPIPTIGHALLCALVPIINLLLLLHLRQRITLPRALRSGLAGASMAIGLFYIVIFLPMMHIVGIGLLFIIVGYGLLALLPLSPHFGALFTVLLSRRIGRAEQNGLQWPLACAGFAASLIAVLGLTAFHLHRINTLDAAIAATSQNSGLGADRIAEPISLASQREALVKLDNLVSERWLEEAMESPPTGLTGFMGDRWDVISQRAGGANKAYYAIHGNTIANQYNKPWRPRGPNHWIGRIQPELKLSTSDMDGWVDSEAGVGYLEWTQVFVNYEDRQLEARQHIELPPGGVVSRVTLWVKGEPREAAFDTVAKTRAAYEYIVDRESWAPDKRDPVLVNAIGRDKIQVEAFPVPPKDNHEPGRMKFRIGITFPLALSGQTPENAQTRLRLPRIVDRNFVPVTALEHSLQLESAHAIDGLVQTGTMAHNATFAMAQSSDQRWWQVEPDTRVTLPIPRDASAAGAFCTDPVDGSLIVSRPFVHTEQTLERVAIVLETSAPLADRLEDLRAIDTATAGKNVQVEWFLAASPLHQNAAGSPEIRTPADLTPEHFIGGVDAVPALEAAVRWAGAVEHSKVIWFHGTQPAAFKPVNGLRTLLELNAEKLSLHTYQLTPPQADRWGNESGCNFIADYLDIYQLATVHSSNRMWTPKRAFEEALAMPGSGATGVQWKLERLPVALDAPAPAGLVPTRPELAKLKAHEEILAAISSPDAEAQHDAIAQKAIAYKLVTPVSGAIVMETREDYLHNGLKPPEDEAINQVAQGGTVPEPSTLLMILLGTGVLFGMRKLKAWGERR